MFARVSNRWRPLHIAAAGLALAIVLMVAAYVFAAIESGATLGGVVSLLSAIAIAGGGLLYAWRLETGGLAD